MIITAKAFDNGLSVVQKAFSETGMGRENTYNGHLLLVKQIVCGKHGLAQFTSESSYRFCYISLGYKNGTAGYYKPFLLRQLAHHLCGGFEGK